jgi:peptidyl-prolyl cis-trans isomerase SurA
VLDGTSAEKISAANLPNPTVLREIDFIVAIVNSEPVTRNEVLAKQTRLMSEWAAQGIRPPSSEDVFKRVLERTIEERAVLLASREAGIRVNDAQITDALLSVARQNQLPTVRALQEKYESEGGNWQNYRDEIRNELTLLQAREREVDNRLRVSEAEIDAALALQNVATTAEQELNLAQILIALPDNPDAAAVQAAMAKARSIIARLKAGGDFGKLATETSDAADKAVGGVMGLRSAQRYPDLFAQTAQNLKVGELSDPVQSGAGLHILKLLARQSTSLATVTQTRARHILLPISKDLTEAQAVSRLNALKGQIELKQTSFIATAKDHSTDSSASQGGDLGWASPGMFVPEFEKVMNGLAIGELSKPTVSRFGVHLIEVVERKEVQVSQRERRGAVREQLLAKKSAEAYALWLTETRQRAFVEYRNQTSQL